MKHFRFLPNLLVVVLAFAACTEDNSTTEDGGNSEVKGAYVINYGNWGSANANITKYDYENDDLTAFYYQIANGGESMATSAQSAYAYNDQVFIVGNTPDEVLVLNESFELQKAITANVSVPRYLVASGNELYISCWGSNDYYTTGAADSYILRYDLTTGLTTKIMCSGGPSSLAVANGKLYAAMDFVNKVAVVDLHSLEVSYIECPAPSSYLVVDKNDNIYVALTGLALGYINTQTDILEGQYPIANIGGYYQIMAFSHDKSKLYILSSSYDENWNIIGEVVQFNTEDKAFVNDPVLSDVSGLNAISVNPENDDLYVFISNGSLDNGEMQIYRDGDNVGIKEVGPSPIMALFLD